MSDVNYEALGRCEHLKQQFESELRLRDLAASRLSNSSNLFSSSPDMIYRVSITKIQDCLEELKLHQSNLESIVNEYNEWAPQAGKKPMQFVSNQH